MICEVPSLAKILQMSQQSPNPRTRRNEKGRVGRQEIYLTGSHSPKPWVGNLEVGTISNWHFQSALLPSCCHYFCDYSSFEWDVYPKFSVGNMSQRKWYTKSYDAPGVQEILSPGLCYEYSHVSRVFLLVCSNKQTLTLGTSWNSAGQIGDDTCFRQDQGEKCLHASTMWPSSPLVRTQRLEW